MVLSNKKTERYLKSSVGKRSKSRTNSKARNGTARNGKARNGKLSKKKKQIRKQGGVWFPSLMGFPYNKGFVKINEQKFTAGIEPHKISNYNLYLTCHQLYQSSLTPPYKWYLVIDIKNVSYQREIKREDADKLKLLASQDPQVRFQSPLYKFVGLYLRHLKLGDSVEDSNNKAVTLINNFNIFLKKKMNGIKNPSYSPSKEAKLYQLSNIYQFLKNIVYIEIQEQVSPLLIKYFSDTGVPERLADLPQTNGLPNKESIKEFIINEYPPSLLGLSDKDILSLDDDNSDSNINYLNAIHLLGNNLAKVNWNELSNNPSAIRLLGPNDKLVNWDEFLLLGPNDKVIKVNWDELLSKLLKNPNAIDILKENLDKIDWYYLHLNSIGIELLKRYFLNLLENYKNMEISELKKAMSKYKESKDRSSNHGARIECIYNYNRKRDKRVPYSPGKIARVRSSSYDIDYDNVYEGREREVDPGHCKNLIKDKKTEKTKSLKILEEYIKLLEEYINQMNFLYDVAYKMIDKSANVNTDTCPLFGEDGDLEGKYRDLYQKLTKRKRAILEYQGHYGEKNPKYSLFRPREYWEMKSLNGYEYNGSVFT